MSQIAFYFDASACSGCKACQVACKDKHGLADGLLWRRVYEVSGGGWRVQGQAWISTVFAYNLSLACNHCEKPICRDVCPAGAITKRADGIVLLDAERCLGCGYCAWACPYGAPQYDEQAGHMTKCDFCADHLDMDLPPACVAACPMRALDYGERGELERRYGSGGALDPLPDPALTGPSLLIRPHKDAGQAASELARIANREEVDRR